MNDWTHQSQTEADKYAHKVNAGIRTRPAPKCKVQTDPTKPGWKWYRFADGSMAVRDPDDSITV